MNVYSLLSFYQLNSTKITISLCFFIFISVVIALSKYKKMPSLAAYAPSLSISLGVFFTFFGLAISLVAASYGGIQDQYSALVGGLSVAFWTSVAGIGISIFAKLILTSKKSTDSPINELQSQLRFVRNEISGIGEHITHHVTEKIITSLHTYSVELDRVFDKSVQLLKDRQNQHLNNIDALNSSLSTLLEKYQLMTDQSQAALQVIQNTVKSIDEISAINLDTISQTKEMSKQIETSISSVSDLQPEARAVFSSIDKMNESLLNTHKKIDHTFTETTVQFESDLQKMKNNIVSDMARIEDLGQKRIADNLSELDAVVKDSLNKILEYFGESMMTLAKKNMKTVAETLSHIDTANTALKNKMEEQIDEQGEVVN